VVYLISAFRWSFYDSADMPVAISIGMALVFLLVSVTIIYWIFKTGYKLKR
jgi:ABC-2 type transport system permease protein